MKFLDLFKYSYTLKKIKKKKVILFHGANLESLSKIINKKEIEQINFTNEVNLRIIFSLIFKKINLFNYCESYIRLCDPEFVITFIDNNAVFYNLKNKFKNKKFISIQNGIRRDFNFQNFEKKNCKSDELFIFGAGFKELYKKKVQSKINVIGSFKNNLYIKKFKIIKNSIGYISQFRDTKKNHFYTRLNGKNLTSEDLLMQENKLLNIIGNFAYKNNLSLNIIGVSDTNLEIQYYKNILKNIKFNFLKKRKIDCSYKNISKMQYIVTFDSTLGYEALSRFKKVIFLNRFSELAQFRFGWPVIKKKNGFNFSNEISSKNFEKMFKNLKNISELEWRRKIKSEFKDLIVWDKDNQIFKNKLKKMGF